MSENLPAKRALRNFKKEQLDKIDFTDRSVLDIGCWDGYWSFYSERRGARKVLASDDATRALGRQRRTGTGERIVQIKRGYQEGCLSL